ncbi:hypothetical protein BDW42DRAFT_168347 [Aspergillus taichungensis]|uniref:Uncharacterized protein n=1 Tax=Aspergillus taichungensis TaxID=482145 RepID=A0A2J5HWK8_9EURO|nr:hypothetical protein BDW42DRAFT_168347 [Aspergillus taichungensis]
MPYYHIPIQYPVTMLLAISDDDSRTSHRCTLPTQRQNLNSTCRTTPRKSTWLDPLHHSVRHVIIARSARRRDVSPGCGPPTDPIQGSSGQGAGGTSGVFHGTDSGWVWVACLHPRFLVANSAAALEMESVYRLGILTICRSVWLVPLPGERPCCCVMGPNFGPCKRF